MNPTEMLIDSGTIVGWITDTLYAAHKQGDDQIAVTQWVWDHMLVSEDRDKIDEVAIHLGIRIRVVL